VVDVTEITRAPSPLGGSVSTVAATLATLAVATASPTAAGVAAVGVVLFAAALVRGSRRFVAGGAALLGVAVLYAGVVGSGVSALVVALWLGVVAWDVGEHAIGVGEQLGRGADSRRVELVHLAGSTFVGALGTAVGYGAYRASTGGQPVVALVFLLLGVVALVAALRS
jgi:hypothetical protein